MIEDVGTACVSVGGMMMKVYEIRNYYTYEGAAGWSFSA